MSFACGNRTQCHRKCSANVQRGEEFEREKEREREREREAIDKRGVGYHPGLGVAKLCFQQDGKSLGRSLATGLFC